MSSRATPYLLAVLLLGPPRVVWSQDASLAPQDMDFTRDIIRHYHFTAQVALETARDKYTNYKYDHYPRKGSDEVERIIADEGTFARKHGGPWLKSGDWAETGTPVSADLEAELDTYVNVVNVQFAAHKDHDSSQGKPVWKFISRSNDSLFTYFCYERSREHPNPNGVYPQLTFMKATHDVDGRLFLRMSTGQLISGDEHVPFTARFMYLVPIPAGTKVQVKDQKTGKIEIDTVTAKDSGWETTAYSSDPKYAAFDGDTTVSTKVGDIGPGSPASTNAASPISPK